MILRMVLDDLLREAADSPKAIGQITVTLDVARRMSDELIALQQQVRRLTPSPRLYDTTWEAHQ